MTRRALPCSRSRRAKVVRPESGHATPGPPRRPVPAITAQLASRSGIRTAGDPEPRRLLEVLVADPLGGREVRDRPATPAGAARRRVPTARPSAAIRGHDVARRRARAGRPTAAARRRAGRSGRRHACVRDVPRGRDPCRHERARLGGPVRRAAAPGGHRRHLDPQVDPVPQRPRDACRVALGDAGRAAAGTGRGDPGQPHGHGFIAATSWKRAGNVAAPAGAGDRDPAVLERLAERLEDVAVELRQLVEEQDAVGRPGSPRRAQARAAADHAGVRDRVVGRAERAAAGRGR